MDTPKKPAKKAAKKATKKAVAPTPEVVEEPKPMWDVRRFLSEEQYAWEKVANDGYEPFAASGNWIYWRKKFD